MKSPTELARRWAKQWEVADTREQRLLDGRSWPVSLPIGKPSAAEFTQRTGDVREHLKRWRAVGIGRVLWERVIFRGGGEPVEVPVYWVLDSPSEWAAACDEPVVRKEFERLGRLVAAADPVFHRTLVRQRYLLQDRPEVSWNGGHVDERGAQLHARRRIWTGGLLWDSVVLCSASFVTTATNARGGGYS